MRNYDCPYECSDDDCYKCAKHGYRFSCEGCEDYENYQKEAREAFLKRQKEKKEDEE